MSDSENRKVQDVLRDVASMDCQATTLIASLASALEVITQHHKDFADMLRACFYKIADRIDKQSVVEVQVPMPSDPFARITELYPMTRAEAISAIEHWLAGRNVAPQQEPTTEPRKVGTVAVGVEVDTSQIDEAIEKLHELGPMTPNVYLNDCVVKVYVDGGTNAQD